MKNAIKSKLNSNRGASMMLALALFLVCIMVSSIIMVAATSNSSRNVLRTKRQRDYLAVSSAAEMLTKELEDAGQFVGIYERKVYGCQDFQNKVTKYHEGNRVQGYEYQEGQIEDSMDAIMVDEHHANVLSVEVDMSEGATTVDGLFKEMIIRAAKTVYVDKLPYEEMVTISLTEADERLPEVSCYFVMDREYNMTFELTTAGSEYAIVVQLEGNNQETITVIEPEDKGFYCEHLIYYKAKQNDGSYADAEKTETIYGTSEYINTIVTWGPPIVSKGVGVE